MTELDKLIKAAEAVVDSLCMIFIETSEKHKQIEALREAVEQAKGVSAKPDKRIWN